MNAKKPPKAEFDMLERLCFYCRDNSILLWPAVYAESYSEYLNAFQDEIDVNLKCKISEAMFDAFRESKEVEKILRPLGKSVADLVEIEKGKKEVFNYHEHLWDVLIEQAAVPTIFSSDEEYLEFMEALDKSEETIRGRRDKTMLQLGLERLAKKNEAGVLPDEKMAETTVQDQSGDEEMEGSPSASNNAPCPEQDVVMACVVDQAADAASFPQSNSDSPAARSITDSSTTSDNTPRTHNQSSSATVVSMDTAACAETSAVNQFPFDVVPEVDESMSAADIGHAFVFAGYNRLRKNGEVLYFFPGVEYETRIRGKNCFSEEELEAIAKEHNYFKVTSRELFTPAAIENEQGSDASSVAIKAVAGKNKKQQPVKQKSPPTKKGTTAKKTPSKTQAPKNSGRTRISPRRLRSCEPKRKLVSSEPFYDFVNLMRVLKNHFGWKYKGGGGLATWIYVRGDSAFGKHGELGVDFFTEETEVVEYCMKNNYKEKFDDLLKEKTVFITPPPTRRERVA